MLERGFWRKYALDYYFNEFNKPQQRNEHQHLYIITYWWNDLEFHVIRILKQNLSI